MRLPWVGRRRRESPAVEVLLPFATTRFEPQGPPLGSPAPPEPAVTLGFRDGSTVEVSPESAEGQALRTAAAALVDRKADT